MLFLRFNSQCFLFLNHTNAKYRSFATTSALHVFCNSSLNTSFFKSYEYVVNEDEANMRLDRFLNFKTGLPTSVIQKKIRKNEVKLKGGTRKSIEIDENITDGNIQPKQSSNISRKVSVGDIVSIRSPDLFQEKKIINPTRRSIESFSAKEIKSIRSMILYQDDEILVINKPPGLATQGGIKTHNHVDGLLHALQFDYPEPPRLVHRLDKGTTGALVLGRTRSAAGKLSFMFQNSTMEKMYTAIVTKFLPREIIKKKIDIPICYGGKPPFEKVTCIIDTDSPLMEKAKSATTDYQVIAGTDNYALLRLYPQTGRKHQLRVHCASVLGASILGDPRYGPIEKRMSDEELSSEPMYLHLRKLVIKNWRTPTGKILSDPITIYAPSPTYFIKKANEIFGINVDTFETEA